MTRLFRPVAIAGIVAAFGLGLTACGDSVKDAVDDAKTTIDDVKTTADDIKTTADDIKAQADQLGVDADAEDSLLRASNLQKALGTLSGKAGAGADALEVDVYPGYLQADIATGSEQNGKRYKVAGPDGDAQEAELELTGPGRLSENVFPLSDVDADTVAATASKAAAKANKTLGDVTYVTIRIGVTSGKPEINVYLGGGAFYTADIDGSGLRDVAGDARKAAGDAQETADCIKRAGTDVSKITACATR